MTWSTVRRRAAFALLTPESQRAKFLNSKGLWRSPVHLDPLRSGCGRAAFGARRPSEETA